MSSHTHVLQTVPRLMKWKTHLQIEHTQHSLCYSESSGETLSWFLYNIFYTLAYHYANQWYHVAQSVVQSAFCESTTYQEKGAIRSVG